MLPGDPWVSLVAWEDSLWWWLKVTEFGEEFWKDGAKRYFEILRYAIAFLESFNRAQKVWLFIFHAMMVVREHDASICNLRRILANDGNTPSNSTF